MIQNICVLGLGRLGAPIAASFALAGVQVTGYDLDASKVEAINQRHAPVQEPGLEEAIKAASPNLSATTNPADAVHGTDACIFVTPTPSLPDGSFHNQYLLDGIAKIVNAVKGRSYFFIIASTVTPKTCDEILSPAIRRHSPHSKLVYKPELIALGTVMQDLAHPDVGLVGAETPEEAAIVAELYARAQQCEFKTMTRIEAELAKISLNCAITMKISFANQVGMVAQQLGADPNVILDFVGRDSRIGSKALRPGMTFSGPCFPRDNRMFQHVAQKAGVSAHLAIATDRVNDDVINFLLRQVPERGAIGILGLAYKANSTITEEAAGTLLLRALKHVGRTVKVHDPLLASDHLNDVLACHTVIITTDCPEYRSLEFGPDKVLIDPLGITKGANDARN